MIAASTKLIVNQLCEETATIYSQVWNPLTPTPSWFNTQSGEAFRIWIEASSESDDPALKIYVDLSPLTETLEFDTTDVSKYITVNLTSLADYTDNGILVSYTDDELDYPFCQMRLRVVGQEDNPDDTMVNAYITQFCGEAK